MVELLPLIDDAEFMLGSEGLGSIAIGALQARLTERGEWDLLAELAALRFARGGRSLEESEIEAALAALRPIPADARTAGTAAASEVFDVCVTTAVASDRSCQQWVAHMLARSSAIEPWPEHQLRLLLVTLDVASQSGDPHLVGTVAEVLAEAERRTGRRPNWRLPIIQAFHSAAAGRLDEAVLDHEVMTRGDRRHPLTALIDAFVVRATLGPTAAIEAFELSVPNRGSDRTAVLYRAMGRLLLGIGTDGEASAAAAVAAAITPAPIAVVTRLMMFGAGAPLARALAGGSDAAAATDELDMIGGGTGLPSAWAWLARARAADDAAERAAALLRSADVLDGLGRHLDAAERVLDAADARVDAVPADRMSAAAGIVARSGATWLVGRAAALAPVAPGPRPAGPAENGGLTAREREVVGLVAEGLTNREVAAVLYISVRTVTSHLDHVYTKLGLSSRSALTEWYRSR
jgi:DNA-binding CsgD family transcriptional regulator